MKKSQKQAIAVGAGVAAIAAAATAAYFLTGKHAKNRKKLAKWAKDMQSDVAKEIGKASKLTKATYNKTVDEVAKQYKNLKNVDSPELAQLVAELKAHWDAINAEIQNASKSVKKVVPKAVKSVTKKVKVATTKKPAKKSRR